MPNGYRRGGTYTRNGKTYHRQGAKIAGAHAFKGSSRAVSRWGLGGSDLAGIGWFFGACEMTFRVAWAGCSFLWSGGKWASGQLDAADKRLNPKVRELSPLVFRLEADGGNGWKAGDVQCKVHHARQVKSCSGCKEAGREQWLTNEGREQRGGR